MIEIDITSLIKTEKRVWVKPTSKRKGHYRKVKGAKAEIEDKVAIKKTSDIKDMNIKGRMEQTFGGEVIDEYNDKLSKLNEDELHEEFKNIIEDKTFKLKFFSEWSRRMDESDGWTTELLDLDKENSKWNYDFEGDPDPLGDEESWMKSILLNQEYLKRKHPSGYIELYRGMGSESYDEAVERGMESGDDFQMRSYNLSSWSEYPEAGDAYASLRKRGIVAKIKVPIENILWSTRVVGQILHEDVHWTPKMNDGQEHVVIGGGYIPVKIHSLKIYDKKITADEYDRIRIKIHKREGLI